MKKSEYQELIDAARNVEFLTLAITMWDVSLDQKQVAIEAHSSATRIVELLEATR